MKKIIFSIAFLVTSALSAQKTIILNGGQFNNPAEQTNVLIYDTQSKTYSTIDTIQSNSVQELIIDGNFAYVGAQNVIVKYDLDLEQRVATASFPGPSIKAMVLGANNELIVGNWFGKTSHNVYIYNANNLALLDSIDVREGVGSMLVAQTGVLISHNASTGSPLFQDTLGYLLAVDAANRMVLDTIRVTNYTGDVGELIAKPLPVIGFYSINSVSNTITDFSNPVPFPPYFTTNTVTPGQNLQVANSSEYFVNGDTAFLSMNNGVGAIDLNNLAIIDSSIVDTLITAFTYDTANYNFYITQTDFSSFKGGKVYSRNGNFVENFTVGFSPEYIGMFYDITTGVVELNSEKVNIFSLYPNPAKDVLTVDLSEELTKSSRMFIVNINGQIVKEARLQKGVNAINTSEMSKGIYLVTVSTGTQFYTQKLIIE